MRYTHDYLVRADECDRSLNARLPSLTNYLQESAGYHATLLKLGADDLRPQGITWMLLRFVLRITRFPRWRENLRVTTWPSGTRGRLVATREYTAAILPDETPFLSATSEWGLVDIQQQRLLRLTDDIRSLAPSGADSAPALPRLPELTSPTLSRAFPVRESQIDFNQHVNNSHYIAWILDTLPSPLSPEQLTHLDIAYRLPANIGDTLLVNTQFLPDTRTCLHTILRSSDNALLIHAKTTWQP